ncbi:MAG: 2TM domain-containing protein [Burkholderiales bacterium]
MNTPLNPDEIDRLARKRAGAKMGWYIHATVYVLVNVFLFLLAMNGHRAGRLPWSIYPALGWGLGLAIHGLVVFGFSAGGGLRDRMIEREREKLRHGNGR